MIVRDVVLTGGLAVTEQLDLDSLRRDLYRDLLKRAIEAGVPRSWIAQIVWELHVWAPQPRAETA